MTNSRTLYTLITSLFLFALSLLLSPVYGSTPTGQVTLTPQEYATLNSNLNELESTINNQLNTINELEQQLKIANLSTSEQKNELTQALNLISEQRTQLTQAKSSLQEQEKMLNEQKLSLAKAEIYLNEQKNEIKKAKSQQRNSKLLNILLGGTVVYLVAKD